MVWVRGLYGFASDRVASIRVTQGPMSRVIEVSSPAGAFVVITIGTEIAELQALDSDGLEIGRPIVKDLS